MCNEGKEFMIIGLRYIDSRQDDGFKPTKNWLLPCRINGDRKRMQASTANTYTEVLGTAIAVLYIHRTKRYTYYVWI